MSSESGAVLSTGIPNQSGGNPQAVVDALMSFIHTQFPAIGTGAVVAAALREQVTALVKQHILAFGGTLTTAGLAILLPSLSVVLVNLIGFTATGVLQGSLAAVIQSSFFGAYTSGAFSALQSFGATAAIANPAVLAVGGTVLVIGAGVVGYGLYRKRQRRLAAEADARRLDNNGDDDDDDEDDPKENWSLIKQSASRGINTMFDSFRRPSE